MNPTHRFRLNEPTVIQEIIDGEAIIADLGRGFYYSMDSLGSQIWNALVKGCSVAGIIDACAGTFSGDREVIASGISDLIDQLNAEQLIVPLESESVDDIDVTAFFKSSEGAFTTPLLSKYTDMEQLLLLDPIHEVDETGWPNQPDSGSDDQ